MSFWGWVVSESVWSFPVAVAGSRLYFIFSLQSSDARFVAEKEKEKKRNSFLSITSRFISRLYQYLLTLSTTSNRPHMFSDPQVLLTTKHVFPLSRSKSFVICHLNVRRASTSLINHSMSNYNPPRGCIQQPYQS
jgi:hypothetical protein